MQFWKFVHGRTAQSGLIKMWFITHTYGWSHKNVFYLTQYLFDNYQMVYISWLLKMGGYKLMMISDITKRDLIDKLYLW